MLDVDVGLAVPYCDGLPLLDCVSLGVMVILGDCVWLVVSVMLRVALCEAEPICEGVWVTLCVTVEVCEEV